MEQSHRTVLVGTVRPPADMVNAARLSLSPEGFEELMREIGERAPTPDELCAKVEKERGR